jgi:flagellar basal body rod protein FlgB
MKRKISYLLVAAILIAAIFIGNVFAAGISTSSLTVWTLADTPTGLESTEITDNSITLSWDHGDNPGVTRYSMESKTGEEAWSIVFDKENIITRQTTGLDGNTTYEFRIQSWNEEDKTNSEYLTNSFLTLPSKPNVPMFSLNSQDISIIWNNIANSNTKLYKDGLLAFTTIVDETSYEFTDLMPATAHEFYIIHENATGNSASSEITTVWTDSVVVDEITVTNRTIDSITVAVVDNNPVNNATEYFYSIGALNSGWTTAKTHTFAELTAGLHDVEVKVRNSSTNTTRPNIEIGIPTTVKVGTQPAEPIISTVPTTNAITTTLAPEGGYVENIEFNISLFESDGTTLISQAGWAKEGEGWLTTDWEYTFNGLTPNTKYVVKGEARYAE